MQTVCLALPCQHSADGFHIYCRLIDGELDISVTHENGRGYWGLAVDPKRFDFLHTDLRGWTRAYGDWVKVKLVGDEVIIETIPIPPDLLKK